jgi:hypothetical protein
VRRTRPLPDSLRWAGRLRRAADTASDSLATPVQVFEGSFRGRVLFENPDFVTPNAVRSYERRASSGGYDARKRAEARKAAHRDASAVAPDPMADRAVFARAVATGGDDDDVEDVDLLGDEEAGAASESDDEDVVGDPDR